MKDFVEKVVIIFLINLVCLSIFQFYSDIYSLIQFFLFREQTIDKKEIPFNVYFRLITLVETDLTKFIEIFILPNKPKRKVIK